MAEESDLEKTESASPRRLERAREEGDVPRSRELATCTILLAAGGGMWMLGDSVVGQIKYMMNASMAFDRAHAFDMELLLTRSVSLVADVAMAFAPMVVLLLIVALGSPLLIGGWLFSAKALEPNFSKMNPMNGLSNMVSIRAAVELAKAIAKTSLVACVAWIVATSQLDAMMGLGVEPLKMGTAHLGHLLLVSFLSIVSVLVVIACIDAPYQMWQYARKLKMTREEVRQEAKESDGNPEIKAKIRAQQREMARRRMMTQVPTADVVITNPTRYAVAIKYNDGAMRAPRVVAKGAGEVAAKIREIANENHVPMLEAPALARALNRHTELGDEIPEALYIAVAEVLAYVFQLRAFRQHGGFRPEVPSEIEVPPHLDPINPAADAATAQGVLQ
jgi:flagellar biosynthesis protein FlhB